MRVRIKHVTDYRYGGKAAFGPHLIRLRPAEHTRAQVLSYNLDVSPKCQIRWQQDPWGNRIARATFEKEVEADRLVVSVDAAFDIRPVNPFDFFLDDRCEHVPFAYPDGLAEELAPFLVLPNASKKLKEFAAAVPMKGHVVDYLVALNSTVAKGVRYIIRNESGIQTSHETLTIGAGSCRDSAVLLVDALRLNGLAARFCSGYLIQLADEGNIPDVAKGVGRDVLDLHAWAEVYVPGAGWIGLDGTSGLLTGEGHIPLAATVGPDLAAPISGTANRAAEAFHFIQEVERLGHEPRPRKPYTDEEWEAICEAGADADDAIKASGMVLTCGGEPTFTSRLHPAEPEWNTEAVGPTKYVQGLLLASELRGRFGNGALAMHRMGKLYPGESLPRWVMHLLWRTDGVPVWRNPTWLDFDHEVHAHPATDEHREVLRENLDAALEVAEQFGEELTKRLGVPAQFRPGYEDPWHFIREEHQLPPDVDPMTAKLDDPEDRKRLARVLTRGLGRAVGYALPLRKWEGAWQTCEWSFKRRHMFLIPGDSPMGLRLPLDRIGGEPFEIHEADTTFGPGPLAFDPTKSSGRRRPTVTINPADAAQRALARESGMAAPGSLAFLHQHAPSATVSGQYADDGIIRTALCIEPRDGVIHIFLPPMTVIEDFLELIAAIEDSARDLDLAVRIEGYPPPSDPRIRSCLVTPDPGVIEVNMPVAESFHEYLDFMETITDAANHSGLCTEKYQIDGRESGPGGGNHLTLGGRTTVESPFLKRPDLLASILRYAQNHPVLSFLFTGLFVGPTSQAPRIDEARHDSLHELELALRQVPSPGGYIPPWLIDRLLRDILIDVAGNTHRTEISIDKLYDPSGPAGRLGIVEFRAFEMPPHERMAAVQMLLVRALTAAFMREPYTNGLVRWGTELHDRFMLPHYLWQDMKDVAADLRRAGLPIQDEWFRPFLDFRCPVAGQIQAGDMRLEVSAAVEPWPTLGDTPQGAVVSRYVDSSLERVQVKVDGLTEGRHLVLVNGLVLPMRPTGTAGERVAGVRFRAWQPPHCMQPNIPVHHPLRFDIVDTWGKRSLGAATYHVFHPEGRGYGEPPLTAFEAAARRAQRFTRVGHAPWPVHPRATEPHPEHPYTLDLRLWSV
jgi:uncharacterized protein (DUF2126 family)/transglutaminase-like putative cysteine protease